jgi:hypothetical protein
MGTAVVTQELLLKNTDDDNMWAGELQVKKTSSVIGRIYCTLFTTQQTTSFKIYYRCNNSCTINVSTNNSYSCLTFNIHNSATITNGTHVNIALLAQNYLISNLLTFGYFPLGHFDENERVTFETGVRFQMITCLHFRIQILIF